ncbi:hypothetical protein Q8F55_004701 [Vanrija albida]|uniref:Uncharacterized protein n=1 Tax=Vanrija albida TaxID=181172 RepID=A0ABR3Q7Q9_9TREE
MGCTSSSPFKETVPTRRAADRWLQIYGNAALGIERGPIEWTLGHRDVHQFLLYLIDTGTEKRVVVVFQHTDGRYFTAEQWAEAGLLASHLSLDRLSNEVFTAWENLCASSGVLGVDRPVRVVIACTLGQELKDNNIVKTSWTLERAGFPTFSAEMGMSVWFQMLQQQGQAGADRFLAQFTKPGDEPEIKSSLNLNLKSAKVVEGPVQVQPQTQQIGGPVTTQQPTEEREPRDPNLVPIKEALDRFILAMGGALQQIMAEPVSWSMDLPIRQFLIYLVDDGAAQQALIVFKHDAGQYYTSSEWVASGQKVHPELGSESRLVGTVAEGWTKLCSTAGVLGIDRPVRMVINCTPDKPGQPATDNNNIIKTSWTFARAGFPAFTAAGGMAEWLRLLRAQGDAGANEFLNRWTDHPDDEPEFKSSIKTSPNEHIDLQAFPRGAPVEAFRKAFNAILPGFVRSIYGQLSALVPDVGEMWIYNVVTDGKPCMSKVITGDGRFIQTPEGTEDIFKPHYAPLHNILRGVRTVDMPSRVVIKYTPPTTYRPELVEVDMTWLPSNRDALVEAVADMFVWQQYMAKDGEVVAMHYIHSGTTGRTRYGDLRFVDYVDKLDDTPLTLSPEFRSYLNGEGEGVGGYIVP